MSLPGKVAVNSGGAATYSIPISVPPGTAGVTPTLSLDYNSQAGNGLLGVGWALGGIPLMGRCPRTMAQDGVRGGVNFDANDRFCLDGQRLIAVSGTYGADGTVYRTEIDTYAKIISRGSTGTGPSWFEVRTKSGQVMEFGNTTDSRIIAQGKTTARLWALNKIADVKGNYLTVLYTNDTTNGQYYPIEINYTGNSAAGLAPYNKVQFVYATRPDIAPGYHAGSLIKTTVRLTNVKTYANAALVADYQLTYGASAYISLLASVSLCNAAAACLPATTFAWSTGTTGQFLLAHRQSNYPTDGQVFRGRVATNGYTDGHASFIGDVNGDGKADIVQIANGTYSGRTLLSNGNGTFNLAFTQGPDAGPIWRAGFDAMSTLLADFDGDGRADILQVIASVNSAQVLRGNADGSFTLAHRQSNYPTDGQIARGHIPANGPTDGFSTFAGDVDGDGRADIVQIWNGSYAGRTLLSNGNGTFTLAYTQNTEIWRAGSDVVTSFLADFDGDGKADILQITNSYYQAQLLLSNGDGSFRLGFRQVNYGVDGEFWRAGNDAVATYLADVNGDGKLDVVQIMTQNDQAQVLFSNGDGTFRLAYRQTTYPGGGPIRRAGTGGQFDLNAGGGNASAFFTFLADMDGDGKSDIVQISNGTNGTIQTLLSNGDGTFRVGYTETAGSVWRSASSSEAAETYVADIKGDAKASILQIKKYYNEAQVLVPNGGTPNLLTTITSGLGLATSITYSPLTAASVYTKDTTATYPVVDIQAALYVASRVDAPNGIGGTYNSSYTYVGAKAEVTGRGYLGFRQTTITDLQTNIAETTTYRQDFPYIGMASASSKSIASLVLNQVANTYQFANASGGTTISPASAPYRVWLSQNVTSGKDLDGTVMPSVTTNYQYDAYGNPTQVAASTSDGFSRTVNNTYTNDVTNWLLGRLTAASVTSVTP